MARFRFLLVVIALLDLSLGAGSVLARTGDRFPSAEQVLEDFGDDPVRAGAACEVMRNAMVIAGGYKSEWSSGNSTIAKQYRGLDHCSNNDRHASAIEAGRISGLAEDAEFERTVAKRYLNAADYARWESYESLQWSIREELASKHRNETFSFFMMLLVPFALCLFFVWRAFRPWRYEPESRTLRFGGRTYKVHYDAGVVVQSNASQSTQHFAGTQTVEVDQFGGRRVIGSTSGHSVTTLRETIHLIEKSGRERVMRLDDWSVSARAGHLVGGLFVVPQGRSSGEYLQIWNFTLDESKQDRTVMLRTFGLRPFGWVMVILALTLAFVIFSSIVIVANNVTGIESSVVGFVALALFAGAIIATILQVLIVRLRRKRYDRDVARQIGKLAAADAREAKDRMEGPITPSD